MYLVFDLRLRTWRAAKVMHHDTATDDGLRERFSLEAAAMANLEHPNVVRVWDVAYDVEIPYLVMELLEGGTTSTWLKQHGPMSAELALHVIDEVLSALEFVHRYGVVHRDVNPRNLLIDRSGTVKLTDFGLARVTEHAVSPLHGDIDRHPTEIGTVMGTEYYMAPEQRRDAASVDARADLYGVGATLFTLLTGKLAPDLTVLGAADPRLRELPPLLAPLIVRACAYRAEDRHPNATEYRAAVAWIRERLTPIDGRTRLAPVLRPLPPVPPRGLEPNEAESLGELFASGAVSGLWDGSRSEVSLMSAANLPPPPPSYARWIGLGVGGSLGLAAIVAILSVFVVFGARGVQEARFDAIEAEHRFHELLMAERPVLGSAAGEAYAAFEAAPPDEQPTRADHLYGVLVAMHTGRPVPPEVRAAMLELSGAQAERLRTYAWWRESSETVCGQVAVTAGLATPPELRATPGAGSPR